MNEDGIIIVKVNGERFYIYDEGGNLFSVKNEDEDEIAEVILSECGEYYEYTYSLDFCGDGACTGSSHINDHNGIIPFFRWLIARML